MRLKRSGRYVLVVGPDGSGKSTLVRDLFHRLSISNEKYVHIHFISRKNENERDIRIMPHNLPARTLFASIISVLYRFIRCQRILLISGKKQVHVIQERGWWDQIVDPKRYRLNLKSLTFVKFLGKFLPHPEIVFVLGGNFQIISERKNELSVDETIRQYQEWLKMKGIAPLVCIDTTNNTHSSEIVFDFLTSYQKKSDFKLYRPLLFPRQYDCFATQGDFFKLLSFFQHKTLSKRIIILIFLFLANIGLKRKVNRNNLTQPLFRFENFENRMWSIAAQKSSYKYRWNVKLISNDIKFMVKMEFKKWENLTKEFTFLDEIYGKSKSFIVPKPISLIEEEGWTILITELLQPLNYNSRPDSLQVAKILKELKHFNLNGITHGDFSKWNIFICTQGIAIIDWESAMKFWIEHFDKRRYTETEYL
jgi:thymidylate kinase